MRRERRRIPLFIGFCSMGGLIMSLLIVGFIVFLLINGANNEQKELEKYNKYRNGVDTSRKALIKRSKSDIRIRSDDG